MDKLGTGTALKTASPPAPEMALIFGRYYDEQRIIDSLKEGFYVDDEELKEIYEDQPVLGAFQSGETNGEADEE